MHLVSYQYEDILKVIVLCFFYVMSIFGIQFIQYIILIPHPVFDTHGSIKFMYVRMYTCDRAVH
jgi:hypothetical protein